MFSSDSTVVRSQEPAFEQRRYAMDARQLLGCCFLAAMHQRHRSMPIAQTFQAAISREAVGTDLTARLDRLTNKRVQLVACPIGKVGQTNKPVRPTQPHQIRATRPLVGEPAIEI